MINFNSTQFIIIDDIMYVSNTLHQQILSSLIMMFMIGITIGLFFGANSYFMYEYLKHKLSKHNTGTR